MPYLSSLEELAKAEVYRDLIIMDLEFKFGVISKKLKARLEAVQDLKKLHSLARKVKTLDTLAEAQEAIG